MTLLERVADYAFSLTPDKITPEVREIGKSFFVDCLGCIIAGAHAKPSMIALQYCREMYGEREGGAAVLTTGGIRMNTCSAAFLNGIASHFHDYDDMLPTLSGHPSAAVLPAVLALCEEFNKSGAEALHHYIVGVEVVDVMARGLNQKSMVHYSKGWHSTESIGIFGATAACGLLLGLNREQMVNALSMAASESSGLQGNFGTMTKAFHAGRANEKAILIAKMAKLGFGANPDILEMRGGFVEATTGEIDKEYMFEKMESGVSCFIDPGITMKPYPCCKCNHNIIDAAWSLIEQYHITDDDVESVLVRAQPLTVGCLKYGVAKTALEGKFSANYNIAVPLVYGHRPGIKDFEGAEITDPKLIRCMEKVTMITDDELAGGKYFNGTWDTPVEITLKDGRVVKDHAVYARGESQNPMKGPEVIEKLRECMAITLFPEKSEPVVAMLENLEGLQSVRELTAAIEAAARPLQR